MADGRIYLSTNAIAMGPGIIAPFVTIVDGISTITLTAQTNFIGATGARGGTGSTAF